MSDVDILFDAISKRQPVVSLQTVRTMNSLLEAVYKKEPRLTGWVASWKWSTSGVIIKQLDITLEYQKNLPNDISGIIVDADGTWRPSLEMKQPQSPPRELYIVTKDTEALVKRINEDNADMSLICPGYSGCSWQTQEKPAANGYSFVRLMLNYLYDQHTYEMYWVQTERKVDAICKRYFGDDSVHKLVKTFLAFSYLQQHCEYDDQALDAIKKNQPENIQRPWVMLPFGPIERNMGVCSGIAYAMQMFLNRFKIPNQIICGETGEADDYKLHAWNLAQFNGQYYHIDATAGVSGEAVYVGAFMKDDKEMQMTHHWDPNKFPVATGRRFDYEFIENYILEHEAEYLRAGVEEKYLFPQDIME